MSTEESQRPKK